MPWAPGVEFSGAPGEQITYAMGRFTYTASFFTDTTGVQTNQATNKQRALRAVEGGVTGGYPSLGHQASPAARYADRELTSDEGFARAGPTGYWEVQTDSGWSRWDPQVPFRGEPGEVVTYTLGRFQYTASFQAGGVGIQMNNATRKERQLRFRREFGV